MKTCTVCKKEIKSGQSWRATGNGYSHLFCFIPKKANPAPRLGKAPKPKDNG